MAVLTISRDIGSGGLELARRTAELTNYLIADKSVIEHIMREYGFVNFDKSYESSGSFFSAEEELTERTLSFLDQVIRAIARTNNCIIIGRGGFVPLTGFSDAIHIRVTAPFSVRVDRVMRESNLLSRIDAEQVVLKKDKARRGFLARYYGVRWEDTVPFDMVVNVDIFGIDPLAHLLADTLDQLMSKQVNPPSVQDISVDPILLEVAQKQLAEHYEIEQDL
ncbi:AAA family ATPase [Gracilinema caldarium]|uniref:Cytidylate kinase, putative n=1 Tax=Gracilinema caldarium (strain ATCC 51460 / DSM 7334 / H1) TaxID=744872 RepID=F8F294_GRAC1|nr:cytidylate kinase-like family protein [Gracilinema caldarium]AEJ20876.1 putative cytidylate kinase, putative [Gracilinema caldarium DSM 7334]